MRALAEGCGLEVLWQHLFQDEESEQLYFGKSKLLYVVTQIDNWGQNNWTKKVAYHKQALQKCLPNFHSDKDALEKAIKACKESMSKVGQVTSQVVKLEKYAKKHGIGHLKMSKGKVNVQRLPPGSSGDKMYWELLVLGAETEAQTNKTLKKASKERLSISLDLKSRLAALINQSKPILLQDSLKRVSDKLIQKYLGLSAWGDSLVDRTALSPKPIPFRTIGISSCAYTNGEYGDGTSALRNAADTGIPQLRHELLMTAATLTESRNSQYVEKFTRLYRALVSWATSAAVDDNASARQAKFEIRVLTDKFHSMSAERKMEIITDLVINDPELCPADIIPEQNGSNISTIATS